MPAEIIIRNGEKRGAKTKQSMTLTAELASAAAKTLAKGGEENACRRSEETKTGAGGEKFWQRRQQRHASGTFRRRGAGMI
jgi:hypothetical protein